MPTESTTRRQLTQHLKTGLKAHAHAVESGPACPGFPDLEYCILGLGQGLLELKYVPDWPKRATTALRVPKVRRAQMAFAKRRWRAGGTCGLAIRVGQDWLLLAVPTWLALYKPEQEQVVIPPSWVARLGRFIGPVGRLPLDQRVALAEKGQDDLGDDRLSNGLYPLACGVGLTAEKTALWLRLLGERKGMNDTPLPDDLGWARTWQQDTVWADLYR